MPPSHTTLSPTLTTHAFKGNRASTLEQSMLPAHASVQTSQVLRSTCSRCKLTHVTVAAARTWTWPSQVERTDPFFESRGNLDDALARVASLSCVIGRHPSFSTSGARRRTSRKSRYPDFLTVLSVERSDTRAVSAHIESQMSSDGLKR